MAKRNLYLPLGANDRSRILTTVGWIILFGRRSALINLIATQFLGLDQPLEINNMPGMIWVQGTDQIPLAFLLLAAALRSMDPSLEEAAMVAGSGIVRTTLRITVRVLLPAILAVWMISFVRAIENFEVPALIGMPAGILVFATEVYLATKNVPTDFGLASTFAVVYLAITTVGIVLYLRWTAVSEQFATITGKGYRPTVFDLGRWRRYCRNRLLRHQPEVCPHDARGEFGPAPLPPAAGKTRL